MYTKIMNQLAALKIVPVVKIDNAKDAAPLAKALIEGGLPIAEVTFRTPAALESIKEMSQFDEMILGAGSVTTAQQVSDAVNAGCTFIVSAGFNSKVADACRDLKVPYFPGICTPTEIMNLLDYELPVAKFFPAGQFGGAATIKALAAPFPHLKFMPTGGVGPANINDYLAVPQIVACGGSWMCGDALINSGDFAEITRLTKEAVELVK